MQRPLTPLNCPNCGAALAESSSDACHVCSYPLKSTATTNPITPRSVGELRAGMDDLLTRARSYGLDNETIVRMLQDELAFAAELARPGRHYSVQVIDLGPHELGLREPLVGDSRTTLPVRPAVAGVARTSVSPVKSL